MFILESALALSFRVDQTIIIGIIINNSYFAKLLDKKLPKIFVMFKSN